MYTSLVDHCPMTCTLQKCPLTLSALGAPHLGAAQSATSAKVASTKEWLWPAPLVTTSSAAPAQPPGMRGCPVRSRRGITQVCGETWSRASRSVRSARCQLRGMKDVHRWCVGVANMSFVGFAWPVLMLVERVFFIFDILPIFREISCWGIMTLALARVSLDTHGLLSFCTGLRYGHIGSKIHTFNCCFLCYMAGFRVLCCFGASSFGSLPIDIDCCSSYYLL